MLLFRGRYRVEAGDCASGLNDFRRATTLSPSNAAAFASQGLAELCVGERKAADASFRRSLALDPNEPKVRQIWRAADGHGPRSADTRNTRRNAAADNGPRNTRSTAAEPGRGARRARGIR